MKQLFNKNFEKKDISSCSIEKRLLDMMYKYKIYNNPSQKKNQLVDQILTLIDDISESKTATSASF